MSNKDNNLRSFDQFEVDLERKILWAENSPVDIPAKAVEILCLLIENPGSVVSKEEMLEKLWSESFVEEGVLPQNIYLLRKMFEGLGADRGLIETIPRRGYRFTGQVREVLEEVEIAVERQTVERKFVVAADYSDDDIVIPVEASENTELAGALRPGMRFSLRHYLITGALVVSILGVIGATWIYPGYRGGDSSGSPGSSQKAAVIYERITDYGRAYYVGLSPDNQIAAYVIHTPENKYSLILHHLATKSDTVVIEPQDAHINCIHFSPDGNYIYYAAQHGKKPNTVYRIPLYGGSSQAVVKNLSHHYSVSPDGEWFAFYKWELKKGVSIEISRSRDGSERRVIASRSGNETFSIWGKAPEWSPDGKKLVATAASRPDKKSPFRDELVEIGIADGKESKIKTPDWYRIGQSYWKKDGKGLFVMVRERKGEPVQIWSLDYPSGAARNVTNDDKDYREFRPASDASFLMAATWSHTSNLFLVNTENTSEVTQLTFDTKMQNGEYGMQWATDGKSIVYSRTEGYSIGNLWVFDVESKKTRQLTFDKDAMQTYIDVTADGKSAVFGSNRKGIWNIWQIDLDGENLQRLTDGDDDGAPEISPDGKWLYYVGNGLWKKPLDGGERVRVMENTPGTTRVSPVDPQKLISYYPDPDEKSENKWKFILYSEIDPQNFVNLDINSIISFEWKPDGSGIYFADRGESFNNLWFLSIDGLKQTQVTKFGDQRISNMSLSPDGTTMAVARGSATGSIVKVSNIK